MDRIQLNGVWYVREDLTQQPEPPFIMDESTIMESTNYAYEDDSIYIQYEVYKKSGWMKFLDKSLYGTDSNREEVWDSESWLRGVAEGNPESLAVFTEDEMKHLPKIQAFLNYLIKIDVL
jgi:hypothetical protein